MKRNNNTKLYKYLSALLALVMCLSLAACGKSDSGSVKDDTVVFTFGKENVYVGETYIYYRTVTEKYDILYGENMWQTATLTDAELSAEEYVREEVINEIVRVKTLVAHAGDYNVKLSDEELDLVAEEAEKFYKGLTDADISSMSISQDLVAEVMQEMKLAKMVESAMLAEDPVEISDEKARMTTFYDMFFNCYIEDDKGNIIPLSEEQKKTQYDRAVAACGELSTVSVDNDEKKQSIEELAVMYNLDDAGQYTLSPEEIKKVYGEEVHDILYSMANGEHSTVIETEYGYHVFKMIALTDKKATQAKKSIMTEEAINERLKTKLTEWRVMIDKSFSYPDSVNMDAYNKIK